MRDVHNLEEIQVCWESSNNQAKEAREGVRAAHRQLDIYYVKQETVTVKNGVQNVVGHPVWERIHFMATAWAEEREFFDVRASGRLAFRTGIYRVKNPYADYGDNENLEKAFKHWNAGWDEAQELDRKNLSR
jgi:hypothetical protein